MELWITAVSTCLNAFIFQGNRQVSPRWITPKKTVDKIVYKKWISGQVVNRQKNE